jgi:diaminohydroxyphosphoribosylaminopyrimidine deaminase/5-amino-6-(5-phosphoribosylamino)uracil reductase
VDFTAQDGRFMARAIALAEQGRGSTEPNPMVGAVIVRNGLVVGEGYTQPYGGPHAEVMALRAAGPAAAGATMYVSLEPCNHYGKTPPCAPAIAEGGIRRVVAAVLDPTEKTGGKGRAYLESKGVRVQVGLCRAEAVRQNAGFFKMAAVGRPLVIAKWAMSADGKLATRAGLSRWVSGPEARELVHAVRGQVDCIMVGARTALMDDPLLTCREGERRRTAARLVVCGGTAPAAGSRLVATVAEAPVLLAYADGAPPEGLAEAERAGCRPLPLPPDAATPGRPDLGALFDELGRRQMTNVLVEGGARLLGALFDAGLVDRVMAFVAPLVVGGSQAPSPLAGWGADSMEAALRLQHARTRPVGRDALIEGWVREPLQWARTAKGDNGEQEHE